MIKYRLNILKLCNNGFKVAISIPHHENEYKANNWSSTLVVLNMFTHSHCQGAECIVNSKWIMNRNFLLRLLTFINNHDSPAHYECV